MSVALSTRCLRGVGAAEVPARLEALGLGLLHVWTAPSGAALGPAAALRAARVPVASVAAREGVGASAGAVDLREALRAAAALAAAARAGAVVAEGGSVPPGASREALVEVWLREVHAVLRSGAPVALRHGAGGTDLLGPDETGWALDSLRSLSLWFDPARAAAGGGSLDRWLDRHAGRVVGVHLSALPGPEDGVPLPRGLRVPWVLDPPAPTAEGDLRAALGYLRANGI